MDFGSSAAICFEAHPRVPKAVLPKVQKAMTEMKQRQGMALLKPITFKVSK